MKLQFSTKAGTLAALTGQLASARIAPLASFDVDTWRSNRADCLAQIRNLAGGSWIIRSSCRREDGQASSNAGAFLSLLDVAPTGLEAAVEQVIDSYGNAEADDEVLAQPMLRDVVRSGVAFSHDPNTCSPYRTVSWVEGTDTASVTGGQGGRTWQIAAGAEAPPAIAEVIRLLEELLALFGDRPVDCEFAVTETAGQQTLWLLQARPLIMRAEPESTSEQSRRLTFIADKVRRGMRPHPFLMGRSTVYGVMPDWNPAEIIGVRPKPLALSAYRDLVTDAIWAYQRHNYGYRNLRSFPLMPHFWGLPYIDVRLSFNSFIPADLDENLAGRLVDYYIDRLMAEPTLHDKVEFEVVFSCYTLDLPQRLEALAEAGFSESDRTQIADSLRRLTNRIIHPRDGLWRTDAAKLDTLNARRETLLASDADPLERIYWLLEDVKRYGTLPFAGLARAGFIAVQLLQSLVSVGVLSQEEYGAFMSGLSTVGGQLFRDRAMLDETTFLSRYGHLRPGTYDLLSPRYDEEPELYFDWSAKPSEPESQNTFAITLPQMKQIAGLLAEHGLHPDAVGLLDFLQAGIELRESSKFHFSRNLSDALSLVAVCGDQWGIDKEDLAYCDIAVFRELHVAAADPVDLVSHSIEQGKARHRETGTIALPPLITCPQDVWAFEWPDVVPNFITQKQITANVVDTQDPSRLAGNIVCIANADPGFDWLFSHEIAGFITAWGGANSHMAIRAGELGLPAVIGAGENLFRKWSSARCLFLDCAGHRVEILP